MCIRRQKGGNLTQEGIDRAFANRPRQSNLIFKYEKFQMIVINGKYTDRLEVVTLPGASGELLDTTSLERTLISEYIKKRLGRRASNTTVKTSLTISKTNEGKSNRLNYEGPASTYKNIILAQ